MANLSVVATFHVFSKRRLQILLNLLLTISYHLPLSRQHFNQPFELLPTAFPQLGPLASLCPKSASAASGASTHQQCLHQPKTPPCWHLMCKVLSFPVPYASFSSLKVKRFQKSTWLKLPVALMSKPSSTQSSSEVAQKAHKSLYICLESVAAFRETCNQSETSENQLLLFTTSLYLCWIRSLPL